MSKSQFNFVSDTTLRSNIEQVFEHIARLLEIVKDPAYPIEAKSVFCKTIIIHTGSVVEALLYTLIESKYSDDNVKNHYSSWQLHPVMEFHSISPTHKVVAGHYKYIASKLGIQKLNLGQMCDFLKAKGDITPEIHKKLTKVRNLRNEQHLATQKKLKKYTIKDVNEVFKIAREVKEFVASKLH